MDHLEQSIRLHAFEPLLAVGLLLWSVLAIQRRQHWPFALRARPVTDLALALLLYWLARLALQYGSGLPAFLT